MLPMMLPLPAAPGPTSAATCCCCMMCSPCQPASCTGHTGPVTSMVKVMTTCALNSVRLTCPTSLPPKYQSANLQLRQMQEARSSHMHKNTWLCRYCAARWHRTPCQYKSAQFSYCFSDTGRIPCRLCQAWGPPAQLIRQKLCPPARICSLSPPCTRSLRHSPRSAAASPTAPGPHHPWAPVRSQNWMAVARASHRPARLQKIARSCHSACPRQ